MSFRGLKTLVALCLVASALHFADNALEIADYPEPAAFTAPGVALAWIPTSVPAWIALSRKRRDRIFTLAAFIFACTGVAGLLHYLYGNPMHMSVRSNGTVLFEAALGLILGVALVVRRRTTERAQ